MALVPEGQHDRSQARSAWNHEEAFDALSLAHAGAQFRRQISVGLTMTSTVPPGRVSLHRYPGTSCLATISLSLRDKSHSPIEAPHNYLSAYALGPCLFNFIIGLINDFQYFVPP